MTNTQAATSTQSVAQAQAGTQDQHHAAEPASLDVEQFPGGLTACLEAVLMAADAPIQAVDIARALSIPSERVESALGELQRTYGSPAQDERHGFELRHTNQGWQYASKAVYGPLVSAVVSDGQSPRLSQAALEALSIVAYKQPVTRAQVGAIRGVNSDGVIRSLLVRGMVREDGVDPESRAALLVTSQLFLDELGLDDLDDLPSLAPFMPSQEAMRQAAL